MMYFARTFAQQAVIAFSFLTALPMSRLWPRDVIALGRTAWAFPLAGLIVGGAASLVWLVPMPHFLAAVMAAALMTLLTGALHEDATADFADAMGGHDREARLAIMRDSCVGSFGAMALIIVFAMRATGLATSDAPAVALPSAAMAARCVMALAMRVMPPARCDGLGHGAGRPGPLTVVGAFTIFAILSLFIDIMYAIVATASALLVALVIGIIACRRLDGQTGDVLGAICLLGETTALCAIAMVDHLLGGAQFS